MTRFGYFLSSEEHAPAELVRQAQFAEQAGFDSLWISDHYHPWLDEQGESGFVWSVIGAISQAAALPVTTAVTCPTIRMHPALVAQAAATSALLTRGKFALGVGTGEALNEHITGGRWPSADERLDMLEEAVQVIRELFTGSLVNHRGAHYTADTARLYSLSAKPPPIYMSGFGEKARKTMHRLWRVDEVPGETAQLLPLPRHFAQASQLVTEDMISAPCGPDPQVHIRAIRAYVEAGFDEVYINQVGPEQELFFEFYAGEVLPRLRGE